MQRRSAQSRRCNRGNPFTFERTSARLAPRQASLTAVSKGPWHEGRRAWQRLDGWHQAGAERPDNGDDAIAALGDIGLIRHLLDQAELGAVRTARRHRKSWAEIATMLGVTRQSAWERWRDLDEAGPPTTQPDTYISEDLVDAAVTEISAAAAWRRRRSSVVVPNVLGKSWDEARHELAGIGLAVVSADPDQLRGWPIGVVTDQSPESGARVPVGSSVRLWTRRDGGSGGVREPRRPSPDPKPSVQMLSEVTGEAVS